MCIVISNYLSVALIVDARDLYLLPAHAAAAAAALAVTPALLLLLAAAAAAAGDKRRRLLGGGRQRDQRGRTEREHRVF